MAADKRERGLQFPSAYELAQHRKLAGHVKRPSSNNAKSIPAKRAKEAVSSSQTGDAEDGDTTSAREKFKNLCGDQEERCAVCSLTEDDEVEEDRGWIQCDDCAEWYHLHCLLSDHETPDVGGDDVEDMFWSCHECI